MNTPTSPSSSPSTRCSTNRSYITTPELDRSKFWVLSGFIDRVPVVHGNAYNREQYAKEKVAELRARGKDAYYCNTLPKHFWY